MNNLNSIIGRDGQKTNACFAFEYKGYEISCSTIFRAGTCEVGVFRGEDMVLDCRSVEQAIEYVNVVAA